MIKALWFALLALGLALPGISFGRDLTDTAKCVDFSVLGQDLVDQQAKYEEARDAAEEKGVESVTLKDMVQDEIYYATQSWVKAACCLYLGDLYKQGGNKEDAVTAWLAGVFWAEKAKASKRGDEDQISKAHEQGKHYLNVLKKRLGVKAKHVSK